jgi:hypothetical protein
MTNNPCCSLLLSSMVPGSRNPMWGEEFDFYTEELPVQVFGNQPLQGIDVVTMHLLVDILILISDVLKSGKVVWQFVHSSLEWLNTCARTSEWMLRTIHPGAL